LGKAIGEVAIELCQPLLKLGIEGQKATLPPSIISASLPSNLVEVRFMQLAQIFLDVVYTLLSNSTSSFVRSSPNVS